MTSTLRVAYTITWDPPEVAGWPSPLDNGSILYLHETGIPAIKDIIEGLQLKEIALFGKFFEAFEFLVNGSADIGTLLVSQDLTYIKLGLGTSWIFLHPLVKEPSFVFFRQPLSENLRITMLRPFTTSAWLAYLLSIIALTFACTSYKIYYKPNFLSSALIHAAQLITGQANETTKLILKSQKIMILVASCFSVLTLSIYTAQIVKLLSLRDELVKIPDDLVKYNYKLSTYSDLHISRLFQSEKLRERGLQATKNILEDFSVFPRIKKVIGKHKSDPREALFAHPDGFYPQAMFHLNYTHELCHVSHFESTVKTSRSLYIRKDSPFREKINIKILQLIERGINFRQQLKFKEKFRFYCPNEDADVNPLSLQHALFAFMLLLSGQGVAIVCIYVFDG